MELTGCEQLKLRERVEKEMKKEEVGEIDSKITGISRSRKEMRRQKEANIKRERERERKMERQLEAENCAEIIVGSTGACRRTRARAWEKLQGDELCSSSLHARARLAQPRESVHPVGCQNRDLGPAGGGPDLLTEDQQVQGFTLSPDPSPGTCFFTSSCPSLTLSPFSRQQPV